MKNFRELSPSRQKEAKEAAHGHQPGSSDDFFRPDQSGSSGQKELQEAGRGRRSESPNKEEDLNKFTEADRADGIRESFIRVVFPDNSQRRLRVNPETPNGLARMEKARFMLMTEGQGMTEEKFEAAMSALLVDGKEQHIDDVTAWKFYMVKDSQPNRGFNLLRDI